MSHLYLYFSGTGNTAFITRFFADTYEKNPYQIHSIEEPDIAFETLITDAQMIVIAYPIYGSMLPKPMADFLDDHVDVFKDKAIMTLATQMMFSGDGGALALYHLKSVHVHVLASMHINMPHNITDTHLFPKHDVEKDVAKIEKAKKKIGRYVEQIAKGHHPRTGRRFYSRALGYLTQRLYFRGLFPALQKRIRIDHDRCITCKECVHQCPVENLELADDRIFTKNQCVLCYRCVNLCPTKAIRNLGGMHPKTPYLLQKLPIEKKS